MFYIYFWFPITAVLSRSLLWSPAWGPSAAAGITPHLLSQCLYLLCPRSPSAPAAPPQPPLYRVPSTGLLAASPSTKRWFFLPNIFRHPGPASFPSCCSLAGRPSLSWQAGVDLVPAAGDPPASHAQWSLYRWEEAWVCIRERSELLTGLSVSGEPWRAPRLEVLLPFPLACPYPRAYKLYTCYG